MSDTDIEKRQGAVDHFWHNYLFILEKSAIPVKSRRWYRVHIETYIAAHRGVKLKDQYPPISTNI